MGMVKIRGYDQNKYPLHCGVGKVSEIAVDGLDIIYKVALEEGKYIADNAFQNQDLELKLNPDFQDDFLVDIQEALKVTEVQEKLEELRKQRVKIIQFHAEVEAAAKKVKQIQDKIRQATGNKEKKLRQQRTKMAGAGVKSKNKRGKAM